MDDLIPRRKVDNREKVHLRKMVRSLVTNLESFQEEVLVVLNDMKDLVGQIDNVSTKLDKTFGERLWKDQNAIQKSRSLTKINHDETHHYVNVDLIPKIKHIEEKINSKMCSKQMSCADQCIKLNGITISAEKETNMKPNRPKSFIKDLPAMNQVKLEDNALHGMKQDQVLDSLESPMLDLSNLDMNQTDNRPKWGRSISLPINVKSRSVSPLRFPDISVNDSYIKDRIHSDILTPTAVCYAELKKPNVTTRSISSSISEDVFHDLNTSTLNTGTTVKSNNSSSIISSNISIDGDLYERRLDDELENILEASDDSLMIESSDVSMETTSNSHTDTYSDNGLYDMNTWTSFTLSHLTESTRSSESFVSDTPSDIMNDNVWPPNVGNIFSNSMLVRKLSKHLDNDEIYSLNQDTKK